MSYGESGSKMYNPSPALATTPGNLGDRSSNEVKMQILVADEGLSDEALDTSNTFDVLCGTVQA